jgi:hypothetical protein
MRNIVTFKLYRTNNTDCLQIKHAELGFNSASSLKQPSAGRHVVPLGHIIMIPSKPVFLLSAAYLAVKQQMPIL